MTPTNLQNLTHPQPDARPRRFAVARARATDERGAALVEFALVLPLLLLVLFGITQVALAFNAKNDETHLANEVARYATVNEDPSSETLQKWAASQADSKALTSPMVCIEVPSGNEIGKPVEVTVRGTMSWFHVLNWFTPKTPLTSTVIVGKAVMRLETPYTSKLGCE